jgi:hypothetical protein
MAKLKQLRNEVQICYSVAHMGTNGSLSSRACLSLKQTFVSESYGSPMEKLIDGVDNYALFTTPLHSK